MKKDFCDVLLYIIYLIAISCVFCILLGIFLCPFSEVGKTNDELRNKIIEYEKIMNKEFGENFESYNEYLVYKINKGE